MFFPPTALDPLRRKRQAQLRIARSRRRIDRRLRAVADDARRLIDWRTCVARHPVWALAAAFGAGMAASRAPRTAALWKWLGRSLLRQTLNELWKGPTDQLRRRRADSNQNDRGRSDDE
ncbi:MAG: hypothetical protein JW959_14550 [Pirellulales bacterium]|nr:hypothetical protein [Pirellulales bacterium]